MDDKLKRWSTLIGMTSGVIGIGVFSFGGFGAVSSWFASQGEVELPATYSNETWRRASADDAAWIIGDWCYPTLGDFKSEFRSEGGKITRRNSATYPAMDTGWVDVIVYKSNRDLIRIWHDDDATPGAYLRPATSDKLSYYENERNQNDAGDISDSNQILALNCTRCTLSGDGSTYDCN